MIELTTDTFEEEALKSGIPVLVDFWAPWCGPCRFVGPILEKLSSEYAGKLKFTKFNVDSGQELAGKYDVRGIPCMIIFRNGKEIERIIGAYPEAELRRKIDMALANSQD